MPVKLKDNHVVGEKITIGIRPEYIQLMEQSHNDVDIVIEVDTIEHLGAETLLYGHIHGSKRRLTVKIDGYWKGKIGDDIHLQVRKEHLHAFDPQSEKRVALNREFAVI